MTATAAPQPTTVASPMPAQTPAAGIVPDTILLNGNIITMDARDAIVQALAIGKGLILRSGTTDAMRTLAGPQTKVIDLQGKTVTPGLIDAHNHLQTWGTLLNDYVSLIPLDVRTLDDLLKKLKDAVAKAKPGEWVQGYYWNVEPLPTRAHLDPISPQNPVWLVQQGGHFGSCNSLALSKAGITARTANPVGGIIERDKNGEPTGVLYNHRAMDMVRRYTPLPTVERMADNIKLGEAKMAEVGVTTFHDNNARFEPIQAYLKVGHAQGMTLRSQLYYTLEWPDDLNRALNQVERYADDYMRFAGYKFLIDGQFPTWYTHEPHPGISWNMPTWDPKMYKETIKTLHDTGLQIAVQPAAMQQLI
jgi:predicted amidohydrolase YtcJ